MGRRWPCRPGGVLKVSLRDAAWVYFGPRSLSEKIISKVMPVRKRACVNSRSTSPATRLAILVFCVVLLAKWLVPCVVLEWLPSCQTAALSRSQAMALRVRELQIGGGVALESSGVAACSESKVYLAPARHWRRFSLRPRSSQARVCRQSTGHS